MSLTIAIYSKVVLNFPHFFALLPAIYHENTKDIS